MTTKFPEKDISFNHKFREADEAKINAIPVTSLDYADDILQMTKKNAIDIGVTWMKPQKENKK